MSSKPRKIVIVPPKKPTALLPITEVYILKFQPRDMYGNDEYKTLIFSGKEKIREWLEKYLDEHRDEEDWLDDEEFKGIKEDILEKYGDQCPELNSFYVSSVEKYPVY